MRGLVFVFMIVYELVSTIHFTNVTIIFFNYLIIFILFLVISFVYDRWEMLESSRPHPV